MVLARLSGLSAGSLNRHKLNGGGLVCLLRTLRLDDNLFRGRMICVMHSALKSEVTDKIFDCTALYISVNSVGTMSHSSENAPSSSKKS